MQRILQINIAGRVIPIEEDAYTMLKNYLSSLERQFSGPEGREIVEDIENRIAELFQIRLQNNVPAIDASDVQKVIDTLGTPSDLRDSMSGASSGSGGSGASSFTFSNNNRPGSNGYSTHDRLLRDPFNKVFGGVCSGVAHYFDIDPVIIRLIMVVLFLFCGIGFLTYIIAWAIIPPARTPEDLYNMNRSNPITFHDFSRNVSMEMDELKRRGEQMSRELKDFFSKKK